METSKKLELSSRSHAHKNRSHLVAAIFASQLQSFGEDFPRGLQGGGGGEGGGLFHVNLNRVGFIYSNIGASDAWTVTLWSK